MPGSRCKPQTSLMTEAPSRAASRATAALPVSIETATSKSATNASSTGLTRQSSSSADTGAWPGRVDSPPMSTIAAPSATIPLARATAEPGSKWRPPSENESGVTLRMPINTGDCLKAARNWSRATARRSMVMQCCSFGRHPTSLRAQRSNPRGEPYAPLDCFVARLLAMTAERDCAGGIPCSRSRGEGRQDARPGAGALVKRRALVFFVGRVDPVVLEGEADQEAVHVELALERADDRDRPAAAD